MGKKKISILLSLHNFNMKNNKIVSSQHNFKI